MQNRIIIKQIAEKRLEEANILFHNGFYDGTCYLAGYSVELSLKVMISKTLDIDNLFVRRTEILKPFKTHDLDILMIYSGLETRFLNDKAADIHLMNAWSYITQTLKWSEEFRYHEIGSKSQIEAEKLLNAVNVFLTWIKNYW